MTSTGFLRIMINLAPNVHKVRGICIKHNAWRPPWQFNNCCQNVNSSFVTKRINVIFFVVVYDQTNITYQLHSVLL